jgi:hypothetical protein
MVVKWGKLFWRSISDLRTAIRRGRVTARPATIDARSTKRSAIQRNAPDYCGVKLYGAKHFKADSSHPILEIFGQFAAYFTLVSGPDRAGLVAFGMCVD